MRFRPASAIHLILAVLALVLSGVALVQEYHPSLAIGLLGSGVLFALWTFLLVEWPSEWFRRTIDSWSFRLTATLVLAVGFAFWAGVVYSPPITSPEDSRNKFVRLSRIPNARTNADAHAVLLEFGVKSIPTMDGFCVTIETEIPWQTYEEWTGTPDRTDKMSGPAATTVYGTPPMGFPLLEDDELEKDREPPFRRCVQTPQLSPTSSYYFYFEFSETVNIAREDIQFLASFNAQDLPDFRRKEVGSEFQWVD